MVRHLAGQLSGPSLVQIRITRRVLSSCQFLKHREYPGKEHGLSFVDFWLRYLFWTFSCSSKMLNFSCWWRENDSLPVSAEKTYEWLGSASCTAF